MERQHRGEGAGGSLGGEGAGTPAPGTAQEQAHEMQRLRTQLAECEQQLGAMAAAQEDFLRAVSHDLRAPLRHITSYGPLVSEVLQDCGLAGDALAEAQGFMATMDQSARRMGRMLDGLLALSRIARAPLQRQPVALAALVAEAQAALAPHTQGRAIEWRVVPEGAVLHGDPALLHQLLTALLDNALKFTQNKDVARIAIEASDNAAEERSPGTANTLRVQDNGVGFNPVQALGLFGVFQRLHREAEFDGVGTGLATVRAIAQRHGGVASATAVPGAGCAVSVVLPCS